MMKGKILGFTPSAGSGAISGDNGERFTFVAAQWRSEKPITVGTTVDFAPMAGVATEIYPVAGTAFGGTDVADLAASPGVKKAKALLTGTLAVPLALLALLAFFMPALSSPVQSASFTEVGKLPALMNMGSTHSADLASLKEEATRLDGNADKLKEYLGKAGPEKMAVDANSALQAYNIRDAQGQLERITKQRADLDKRISAESTAATMESLLVLRYAAPLLALVLIWQAWRGAALRLPSLAAGGGAILAFVTVYAMKASIGIGIDEVDARMQSLVSLGIGAWLMALCGIGLILAGLGIITNPLADKA